MKGLLLKDFYMAAKYCKAVLLLVIVFLAASFLGEENIFFIVYPSMIAGIIPMSILSYEERDKWIQYSAALPYTKAQVVSSKYLLGLLFWAAAFLVSMAATAFRMIGNNSFSMDTFLVMGTALLILGLIGPTFLLPFVFKFGAEKGRIAFYVMIGFVCAVITLLTGLGFQAILPFSKPVLIGICGIGILLYILSWQLSILFFKKREL